MKVNKLSKIYYLVSSTGQVLEAHEDPEKFDLGISALDIVRLAHGHSRRKVKVGFSYCKFKVKVL